MPEDDDRPDDEPELDGDEGLGSDASFLRRVAGTSTGAVPVGLPAEGDRVGKYVLGPRLGAGGMGIVFSAEDASLRRTVALKIMRDRDGDPDSRRRFLREARAASAIRHPNIANVFEVGQDGDRTFLAMELVPGETLRARMDRGAVEIAEVLRIGREIAAALVAAHAAFVIHRDLKPDNVMIEPDGRVRVLDFGLARWVPPLDEGAPRSETLTVEGNVLGTPGYMSPEQGRGLRADASTDLFALGVVLFELATGARPFVGATKVDVLIATNREPTPNLSERCRAAPRELAQLVSAMLEKDPGERPASAADVHAALDRLLRDGARPSSARRWALIVLAAVLVSSAVGLAVRAAVGASGSTPASTSTATPTAP